MPEQYRVRRKRHVRSRSQHEADSPNDRAPQVFEPGDFIEPTDAELEAFPDRFEKVYVNDSDEEMPVVDDSDLPDPSEYTITELRDLLGDGEYDDHIDDLIELEQEHENRNGAIGVLEERKE